MEDLITGNFFLVTQPSFIGVFASLFAGLVFVHLMGFGKKAAYSNRQNEKLDSNPYRNEIGEIVHRLEEIQKYGEGLQKNQSGNPLLLATAIGRKGVVGRYETGDFQNIEALKSKLSDYAKNGLKPEEAKSEIDEIEKLRKMSRDGILRPAGIVYANRGKYGSGNEAITKERFDEVKRLYTDIDVVLSETENVLKKILHEK